MKEAWPSFEGKVAFIPLDIAYGSDITELHVFADAQGYPWPVGRTDLSMLDAFGVTIQSTKIVIDSDGVIIYRAGYGKGTVEEWGKIIGIY